MHAFLVMWWPSGSAYAGQCGDGAPLLDNGKVPQCDPDDVEYHCCSKWGYCGSSDEHCKCDGCVDYSTAQSATTSGRYDSNDNSM